MLLNAGDLSLRGVIGGPVIYSEELRAYLASLPSDEAQLIVAQIEHKYRYRRVIINRADLNSTVRPRDSTAAR